MSTKPKAKKNKYAKSTPKSSWHDRADAQEYAKKLIIHDNIYPSTGDMTEHKKEIKRKLNEYAQLPDETDKSYIDRGRHLLEEAQALKMTQEEKELVDVAMRNLNGAWSVVKNQYVLNYDRGCYGER